MVGPPGFADGLYTPPEGENGNVVVSHKALIEKDLVVVRMEQPLGATEPVAMRRAQQVEEGSFSQHREQERGLGEVHARQGACRVDGWR